MEVFYEVNAVFGCAGVEVAEGFYDMGHLVAAVVEDDVRGAELVEDALEKGGIGLAADADLDLIFFKLFAFGIDIEADDLGVGTEVALPHLGGTAAAAPNLQKEHGPVDVAAEVGLVGGEVVLPLMDGAVFIVLKVRPETQRNLACPWASDSGLQSPGHRTTAQCDATRASVRPV